MSGTPKTWRLGTAPWAEAALTAPRARVIVDNDFSGDPDDFFQLVHHLLSPTVEIPFVVASHLRPGDPMDPSGRSAQNAERLANEICTLMGLEHDGLVVRGAEEALRDRRTPRRSAAARRIVDEAMREDTDLPLYYAAGGGLTDLASACLLEPRVARRLTLVWIGGAEPPGTVAPPPGVERAPEYNCASTSPLRRSSSTPRTSTSGRSPATSTGSASCPTPRCGCACVPRAPSDATSTTPSPRSAPAWPHTAWPPARPMR